MSVPSPSTDIIAALDGPFVFARRRFAEYAPTVAICILLGVVPAIPQAFLGEHFQQLLTTQGGDPMDVLKVLPLMYIGPCVSILGLALGFALEAAIIGNLIAGRGAGFGEALRVVGTGRFWIGWILAGFLNGIGWAFCCFGGFLLIVPFGLMVAGLVLEGRGIDCLQRSVELSFQKTGPGLFDRPGWKVAAVVVVSYTVTQAFAQAASLPLVISMFSNMFDAIKSSDPEAVQRMGMVSPWLTVATQILTAAARVFTDTYALAGAFLIFRDAAARQGGADLEKLIEEIPRA